MKIRVKNGFAFGTVLLDRQVFPFVISIPPKWDTISKGRFRKRGSGLDADLKVKDTSHKLLKSSPIIENLKLSVDFLTDKILRFKITDANTKRYEVPIDFNMVKRGIKEENEAKRKYSVEVREDSKIGFQLTVERKETKSKMYGISLIIIYMKLKPFISVSTLLSEVWSFRTNSFNWRQDFPSTNIYGMGENTHQTFKHELHYKTVVNLCKR